MKLHEYPNDNGRLFVFFCPGCGYDHPFHVGASNRPTWEWNGSFDAPTFAPSLVVFKDDPGKRCHLFLTNGQLQFLADSHHQLAGRTVPCPEYPD